MRHFRTSQKTSFWLSSFSFTSADKFEFFLEIISHRSQLIMHNVLISSIIFNWLMEIIHSITPLFAALSSLFFISFFEITQNHKLPVYGWAWMRRIFEYFFIFAILCLLWIGHEYMLARYLFYFDATHQPAAFHIEAFYTYVKFDIFQYILCRVSEAKSEILIHKINKCMCPYLE